MKKFLFLCSMAVLVAACGQKDEAPDSTPLVRLTEVQAVKTAAHASYPGRTKAAQTSNVAFRVSGTIAHVKVKEGDAVHEGQVIALMDDRDYKVQLSATEAEYKQIKADCERVIGLYQDGSTTAQNYDKARYGLEQITAKYKHAQDQLADCQLRAPFSGYVQNVLREDRETVIAGVPIVSMFCSNGMEIEINIPASEYMNKDLFDGFMASFDVFPGRSFPLRMVNIARRPNANQLYNVRLLLVNEDENKEILRKITPGMVAMVDIRYSEDGSSVVEVPAGAVFYKDGKSFVYVCDNNAGKGVVRQTEVSLSGLKSSGTATISSGLRIGQYVVECGAHYLNDGQTVRINPAPSRENVGGLL